MDKQNIEKLPDGSFKIARTQEYDVVTLADIDFKIQKLREEHYEFTTKRAEELGQWDGKIEQNEKDQAVLQKQRDDITTAYPPEEAVPADVGASETK